MMVEVPNCVYRISLTGKRTRIGFALLLTEAHNCPRSLHWDLAFQFYSQYRGRKTVDMTVEVPGLAALHDGGGSGVNSLT